MDITKSVNIAELVAEEGLASLPYAFYDISISADLAFYEKQSYKIVIMRYNAQPFMFTRVDGDYILKTENEVLSRLHANDISISDGDFVILFSEEIDGGVLGGLFSGVIDSMENNVKRLLGISKPVKSVGGLNKLLIMSKGHLLLSSSKSVRNRNFIIKERINSDGEILNGHRMITNDKNPHINVVNQEIATVITTSHPFYLIYKFVYIDFSKVAIDEISLEKNETIMILQFTDSVGDRYVIRVDISEIHLSLGFWMTPDQLREAFVNLTNWPEELVGMVALDMRYDTIYKFEDYDKIPENERTSIPLEKFSDLLH